MLYAFSERFILPLSHDEVVYGKHSLIGRMPGDHWQRFANLRAYLGFMWTHPAKKLLFMGGEFGQEREWNHDGQLEWRLLDDPAHRGMQRLVRDLNRIYAAEPALYEQDYDSDAAFAGSCPTTTSTACSPVADDRRQRSTGAFGQQFHAGPASWLPARRAGGREVARAGQHRRHLLRRLRLCQRSRYDRATGALARSAGIVDPRSATAGDAGPGGWTMRSPLDAGAFPAAQERANPHDAQRLLWGQQHALTLQQQLDVSIAPISGSNCVSFDQREPLVRDLFCHRGRCRVMLVCRARPNGQR